MTEYISTLVCSPSGYVVYRRSNILNLCTYWTPSYDLSYHSSSHGSIGSIVAHAASTNSLSSALSSCDTCLIRSVIRVNILNKKTELQSKEKIKGVILKMDNNRKIRYNYPQLIATQEELKRVYKSLKSF